MSDSRDVRIQQLEAELKTQTDSLQQHKLHSAQQQQQQRHGGGYGHQQRAQWPQPSQQTQWQGPRQQQRHDPPRDQRQQGPPPGDRGGRHGQAGSRGNRVNFVLQNQDARAEAEEMSAEGAV